MSRQTPSIKGTCPVCREDVNADEPHERTYKHRNCEAPSSPTTVYVLVRTSDKWPPAAHYECQAESTVIGVYATYGQARKAKLEATEGMETADDFTYHEGTDFCSTFEIFGKMIQDDGTEDSDEDGDY